MRDFVLPALVLASVVAIPSAFAGHGAREHYRYPTTTVRDGSEIAIDWCKTWATDCGQVAADYYCSQQDGGSKPRAVSFQTYKPEDQRTWVMGSGQVCQADYCTAFQRVTCAE